MRVSFPGVLVSITVGVSLIVGLWLGLASTTGTAAALPAVMLSAVALAWLLARPAQPLALFLFAWAPSLFLLKDVTVTSFSDQPLNLSRALGALLFAGLLGRVTLIVFSRDRSIRIGPAILPLFVFGFYLILSFIRSPDPAAAGAELLRYWTGILFLLVLRDETKSLSDLSRYAGIATAGITIAAIITLVARVIPGAQDLGLIEVTAGVDRAAGTMGAAGATAALLFAGIPMLLAPPSNALHGLFLKLRTTSLILIVAALVATLTRGILICLPPYFLCWLYLSRDRRRRTIWKPRIVVIALLSLALLLGVFQSTAVSERLQDIPFIGTTLTDPAAGTGRLFLWTSSIQGWLHAPLVSKILGLGLHSSPTLIWAGLDTDLGTGPHNTYLWLLVETGIIGVLLYFWFVIAMTSHLLRRARGSGASGSTPILQSFFASAVSFFITYHLLEEMFMSQVVSFGGHAYMLALLALATAELWPAEAPGATLDSRG
jgi:O-antigen ligase